MTQRIAVEGGGLRGIDCFEAHESNQGRTPPPATPPLKALTDLMNDLPFNLLFAIVIIQARKWRAVGAQCMGRGDLRVGGVCVGTLLKMPESILLRAALSVEG